MPEAVCEFTLQMFITIFSLSKIVLKSDDEIMLSLMVTRYRRSPSAWFGRHYLNLESVASG